MEIELGYMLDAYQRHNQFKQGLRVFKSLDPHLKALSQLKYRYSADWWRELPLHVPGIYILTGGRQIGKSTSCKLLLYHCLQKKLFSKECMLYLPCDEIFDAKELSHTIRFFLDNIPTKPFLLIIDEVTFVKNWDRVIKALADEGYFTRGLCLLTGSDTLILKEAAMRFPGRRGQASKTDFHLHPLSFKEFVQLLAPRAKMTNQKLLALFEKYLICGGYLRAINDLAVHGKITKATFLTYEQWLRGDFLRQGKSEETLLQVLRALFTVGVSQISYSGLAQKIGLISKMTCMDYIHLLERMDILMDLQAFDSSKKQGFPRKARKFHFLDPFICQTIFHWLKREGYLNGIEGISVNTLVEGCVASHCQRLGRTYYYKGQGEIDVIWLHKKAVQAIEVKWANQLKSHDLKMLRAFKNSVIVGKSAQEGSIDHIHYLPVYRFLYSL